MPLEEDDLEFVSHMLVHRIAASLEVSEVGSLSGTRTEPGVVFLLGAGCSRQYGLPSFKELLVLLWEDFYQESPNPSWGLEVLRDRLDRVWQSLGSKDRQEVLKYYLRRGEIHGRHCPGYRRLAELAKLGGVRAFVNLNFDTLLEEALEAEGVSFRVSASFQLVSQGSLIVYKPHGLIALPEAPGGLIDSGELILDIATSDLLTSSEEQSSLGHLLGDSDVVVIGYSGVDAKIVAALRATENPRGNHKLFVINPTPPDPRLALVAAERASVNLVVRAGFESFMERLRQVLLREEGSVRRPALKGYQEVTIWTPQEEIALKSCLRLAYGLQADSGINDLSSDGIEAHAERVFARSLELARSCGVALTGPEKFLLQAASYLYEAACFSACGHWKDGSQLERWRHHGRLTVERISDQLRRVPQLPEQMTPSSYEEEHRGLLRDLLLKLCEFHASLGPMVSRHEDRLIRVNGIEIPLRYPILQALLALADQIEGKQPFLPSFDPELREALPAGILDSDCPYIHLKHSNGFLYFELLPKRLFVRPPDSTAPPWGARELWQIAITALFLERLDEISRLYNGWGIELFCDLSQPVPGRDRLAEVFAAALREPFKGDAPELEVTPVPTAFISYSWDSREHRAWVRNLATRLRQDGIDVTLDQWEIVPGDYLTSFMEDAIGNNDFVLIVCTPKYKDRSDGRIGGVGYEGDIMTAEAYQKRNARKFIPLLREGAAERAMPKWLQGKRYLNLQDDSWESGDYVDLLDTLLGRLPKAPPLGRPPLPQRPSSGLP